jgi:hypothetical protein
MADGILSRQFFEIVPVEDFGDEPHLPIVIEPGSIRGNDTRAFLAAMLKGIEA